MNLSAAGQLDLSGAVAPAGAGKAAAEASVLAGPVLWAEGAGGSLALRLGVRVEEVEALPPVPPAGLFDARVEVRAGLESWQVPAIAGRYRVRLQGGVERLRWELPAGAWGEWAMVVGPRREVLVGSGAMAVAPGVEVWLERAGAVPGAYALWPNYPNPFNPETTIAYEVPQAGPVQVRVYGVTGQLVRELVSGEQVPGRYRLVWDGRDDSGALVGNGVYLSELRAGAFRAVRKMALIK